MTVSISRAIQIFCTKQTEIASKVKYLGQITSLSDCHRHFHFTRYFPFILTHTNTSSNKHNWRVIEIWYNYNRHCFHYYMIHINSMTCSSLFIVIGSSRMSLLYLYTLVYWYLSKFTYLYNREKKTTMSRTWSHIIIKVHFF